MSRTLARITVAIPTAGHRDLVALLSAAAVQADQIRPWCEVVVLDNSSTPSARVRDETAAVGARYVHVPDPGLTAVRNAALTDASTSDAIVFVDDDELPLAGWLNAHVLAAERYDADVAVGPVPVRLPADAPSWLGDGSLLRAVPERALGPFEGHVYSGNTLIRLDIVARTGLRFDPRYNAIGGEDTAFFHSLRKHGARAVWAPDAVAVEIQDGERLTLHGFLRRSYAAGKRAAVLDRSLREVPASTIVVRRSFRCARGVVTAVRGALTKQQPTAARGLGDIAFGVGSLVAVATSHGNT